MGSEMCIRDSASLTSPMPTPPLVISYERTQLMHLSGGAPATPPYIGDAHAASSCPLPAHPVGASLGRAHYHASLHRQRPRRLRPSPNGASGWCISREPLPRLLKSAAYVASGRLLPAHPVGASVERGSAMPTYIGTPTTPQMISYWHTQLVHYPEGTLQRLPTSVTPTPPPAVSYRRTQLVHLP